MNFDLRDLPRVFQPKKGLFWLMLALNGASTGIMWLVHTHAASLTNLSRVVLALFALGNLYFGLRCMRELMREPPNDRSRREK